MLLRNPKVSFNINRFAKLSDLYCGNHVQIERTVHVNTGSRPKAGIILVHRLRRWPNIIPAMDQRPVCAGHGALFLSGQTRLSFALGLAIRSTLQ